MEEEEEEQWVLWKQKGNSEKSNFNCSLVHMGYIRQARLSRTHRKLSLVTPHQDLQQRHMTPVPRTLKVPVRLIIELLTDLKHIFMLHSGLLKSVVRLPVRLTGSDVLKFHHIFYLLHIF